VTSSLRRTVTDPPYRQPLSPLADTRAGKGVTLIFLCAEKGVTLIFLRAQKNQGDPFFCSSCGCAFFFSNGTMHGVGKARLLFSGDGDEAQAEG
jgi:hypothetical protein